jgi:hypothetical protein
MDTMTLTTSPRSATLALKLLWYAGRRSHAPLSARALGPSTPEVA